MRSFLSYVVLASAIVASGCANALVTEPMGGPAPTAVHPENRDLKPRGSMLKVGDPVPAFFLYDQNGAPVTSGELTSGGAVLIFVPGVASAGARPAVDFAKRNQTTIGQQGAEILIVTPQPMEVNKGFAEREQLRLAVLSDPNAWVARAYGANPEGRSGPITYVLGSNGRIQLARQGVPDASDVIFALQAQPGEGRYSIFNF